MSHSVRGKVLIVDDVPTNTELLGMVLGQEFDVVQATSGPEAIDIARGGNIDLVLLDIIMPGMDGYDVCRALKADPVTAGIPIIFITAMSEEEDEEAGLEIGAIDYVTKPFSLPIVRARVRNHLLSKARADALEVSNSKLEHLYRQMSDDLDAASRLQNSFLPKKKAEIGKISFGYMYYPSQYLCGDTLNFFNIGNDIVAFYIADIAGHGIPSALLSVTLSNTMTPEFCTRVSGETDSEYGVPLPSTVVSALNRRFLSGGDRMDYLTMIYGVINTATGATRLCQAAQPSPVLLRKNGVAETIGDGGFPVGMFDDATYEDIEFTMRSGDRLAIFSDGITECENATGVQFGEKRLTDALFGTNGTTLNGLQRKIQNWTGQKPPTDDVSLLLMALS
jgi:phosphoserine phosphatase RsbU/P